jgi:acyl-CoA dehydrogenase
MPLVLTEEQALLKSTAEKFFGDKAPVSALRKLRDEQNPDGFSRDLWREMVDMGWPGTVLPEQFGGLDCGFTELGVVLEAGGRTLAASPLFATVALGASAILLGGNEAQKNALLPRIARGELLLSLALEEGPHHDLAGVAATATADGDNYRLSGRKVYVVDGHIADRLIVVARTAGERGDTHGLSLFLVASDAPGVRVERQVMVDSRNMAAVQLQEVAVSNADLLGAADEGYELLTAIIDRGNIALCAEMLGSLQAAFERTMDYLKQREQFGALIGSFQALQHRAAKMFCEIELSKSVVLHALHAVDSGADNLSLIASMAKVQVAETFRLVGDEGIQMFGGIGMTDEEDIGFYLKRARVAQQLLGDEHYHVQRYARLRGY